MPVEKITLAPEADWSRLMLRLADAQAAGLTVQIIFRNRRPEGWHAPKVPKTWRPRFARVPRPRTGAVIKLREMLRETPNLCEVKTLTDIGKELGVSRERVRQLLPTPPAPRPAMRAQNLQAERSRQLAKYVETHPLALLPPGRGGPTFKQIAADLGWQYEVVLRLWRLCEYPDRLLASRKNSMTGAEQARYLYHEVPGRRERQLAAIKRWHKAHNYDSGVAQKRVISHADCWQCGEEFDVTWMRGYQMRIAGFVTCSGWCTRKWNAA